VLQIFGVKARTGETQGFYSIAQGLCISDDGKPVLQDGWNNHISGVKNNRVKPLTSKVIKKTALGCDDTAAVLGDGHINLVVDGIAVYHIPISSMEKWKPTTSSSCNANVPDEVEVKGKGKKRAASSKRFNRRDFEDDEPSRKQSDDDNYDRGTSKTVDRRGEESG
jgi:hypothetical protein